MEDQLTRPKLTGILTGLDDKIKYKTDRQKKWQSLYSSELVEEICDEIAANPIGLRQLWEKFPNWPSRCTFFGWMRGEDEQSLWVRSMYDRAREDQVESLVSENLSIVHDDTICTITQVNIAKMKCDEHWKQASKIKSRKYGERSLGISNNVTDIDPDIEKVRELVHEIRG